jgi:hypothetical protein
MSQVMCQSNKTVVSFGNLRSQESYKLEFTRRTRVHLKRLRKEATLSQLITVKNMEGQGTNFVSPEKTCSRSCWARTTLNHSLDSNTSRPSTSL